MTKTAWNACRALSLLALLGAAGCTMDGTSGVDLDGGTISLDGALQPRGTLPPPCISIPCPPPPPPPPDPSTWLPACTSAINAAYASYPATLRSALGSDVSLGVVPYWTSHGVATCYHEYSNGSIEWSSVSGAFEVHGAIYGKWASLGYEEAAVGMPTTNESDAVGGRFNHFTNGSIYWNGSSAFEVRRPIETKWASMGWERGRLGMPTSSTALTPNGLGSYNHFTGGSIYTSAAGTFFVTGAIRDRWQATGWEAGPLGFPTSDEIGGQPACKQPGCGNGAVSHFQRGSIYWAPSGSVGAHSVSADLEPTWLADGGPAGCHGYPIGEPAGTSPATQSFEGGSFSYTPGVGGSAHANGACCGLSGSACCTGSSFVCNSGLSCQGGICAIPPPPPPPACGAGGQACCGGTTCNNSSLACVSGTCRDCGTIAGNVCCAGNDCHNANLMCVPNAISPTGPNVCAQCGVFNTRCCPGNACASGLTCQYSSFDSQYYCLTPH
jgi:hypothetical protein